MTEGNNLSHSFGEKDVLRGINLKIRDGEIWGLIGANGAGIFRRAEIPASWDSC